MKLWAVCFEPEDWVAFREIRRFNPSDRVKSVFPSPFPFYGALRTAILKQMKSGKLDFQSIELTEEEKKIIGDSEHAGALKLFGPFIFESTEEGEKYYLPASKNIYELKKNDKSEENDCEKTKKSCFKTMPVLELKKKVKIGNLELDLAWMPEFDHAEESKHSFIELREMEKLRRGEKFAPMEKLENLKTETRLGIALEKNSKRTAEGMIYTLTYYRFKNGGFAMFTDDEETVELIRKYKIDENGVFLGAKQRWAKVCIKEVETDVFEPPDGKVAISLVTPAIFDGGIAPNSGQINGAKIITIAGQKKTVISGWDLISRKPKPIYHAASPGTVYYLNGPLDWTPLGEKYCDFGFGRFVYMKWEYFRKGDK